MPTFVDEDAVHEFADQAALEDWYVAHHATASELWLKFHKKGSGLKSVSGPESLDVALCWGWIDGIRKPFDEKSFLQRYTPRTKKSRWSTRNQDHVRRLIAEGRMRAPGQAQIDLAKADGRWARAYDGSATMEFPGDLLRAIEAQPDALEAVKEALTKAGVKPESAELGMVPQNYIKLTGQQATQMLRLVEALEEHDDVQHVYANFDIDESEIQAAVSAN